METLERGSKKECNSNSPDSKLYRNSIEIKTPEDRNGLFLCICSDRDILPNNQTDEMKAVRQFSIVLIFSVQPAVTTHLRTAMQAMVTMDTVVEREMPTALRTK